MLLINFLYARQSIWQIEVEMIRNEITKRGIYQYYQIVLYFYLLRKTLLTDC